VSILRVFPRRTSHTPRDPLAFVGRPPLFRPAGVSEIHVSVAFTWDKIEAARLARAWGALYPGVPVHLGGPAYGDVTASAFVPGRYVKHGVTFTTRGCNRRCPWCLVPSREGRIVEIQDFVDGHIIQDNNFLQASSAHQDRVFAMLRLQRRGADFAGGIDCRLVNARFADRLRSIRVKQLFLAADTNRALHHLERAVDHLRWLGRRKLRCYTLIGFGNDTIPKATARLEQVWRLGALPHAQLYQPDNSYIRYPMAWRALSRTWSRPAAMFALHATPAPRKASSALIGLFGEGS